MCEDLPTAIERIFKKMAQKSGYVDASAIFIDSTHIKASASKPKSKKVTLTKPIKQYQSVKGEHERCFAYSSQTACDKHGLVLNFKVVAGNVHDSQSFHQLYEELDLKDTKIVALDAGYKTPSVLRKIFFERKTSRSSLHSPENKRRFFQKIRLYL